MKEVIIIDIGVPDGTKEHLESLDVSVVESREATRKILFWEGWKTLDPKKTLLVFPGHGASLVRESMSDDWLKHWATCSVYAKRYWEPGADPEVVVRRISSSLLLGLHDIIVIDDVVSSGTTVRKLKQLNEPWIPGSKWSLVTWVGQKSFNGRGFDKTYVAEWFGSPEKKVAINSISTLLTDNGVLCSLASRRFEGERRASFLEIIQEIGRFNQQK